MRILLGSPLICFHGFVFLSSLLLWLPRVFILSPSKNGFGRQQRPLSRRQQTASIETHLFSTSIHFGCLQLFFFFSSSPGRRRGPLQQEDTGILYAAAAPVYDQPLKYSYASVFFRIKAFAYPGERSSQGLLYPLNCIRRRRRRATGYSNPDRRSLLLYKVTVSSHLLSTGRVHLPSL